MQNIDFLELYLSLVFVSLDLTSHMGFTSHGGVLPELAVANHAVEQGHSPLGLSTRQQLERSKHRG